MNFDDQKRYSRQIILPQVGRQGQERIMRARVAVVGAGGLGSPLLLYLAASGLGEITIIDHDNVDISNLPRQVLFEERDVGTSKVGSAYDVLKDRAGKTRINTVRERLNPDNIDTLLAGHDIVADCTDRYHTRSMIASWCMHNRTPLASAAVTGFDGQFAMFMPYLEGDYPCYHCLYPDVPDDVRSCEEQGIMGPVAGMMGCLQALEIIKFITGAGKPVSQHIIIFNGMSMQLKIVRLHRNINCKTCVNPSFLKEKN